MLHGKRRRMSASPGSLAHHTPCQFVLQVGVSWSAAIHRYQQQPVTLQVKPNPHMVYRRHGVRP